MKKVYAHDRKLRKLRNVFDNLLFFIRLLGLYDNRLKFAAQWLSDSPCGKEWSQKNPAM